MKGDNSKVSMAPDTPVKPMIQPGNLVQEAASDYSLTNPKEATTEFTVTMDCLENNMSFCDVMALADAAGAKTASGSNNISGSIPVAQFDHCNKQTKQGNEKANQDKVVGIVQQREQSSDVGSEQVSKESNSGQVNNASLGTSTPAQQKPRRKKYMPKVVREGQTKRTRNVKAQQSVRSNDVQTPKRRSVRRKGTSIPPSAHFVDLTETEEDSPSKNSTRNIQPSTPLVDLASSKPKTDGLPRKSSKRSLNFDTCFQVGKESSSWSHASGFHLKSQAQSSYTEIQSSTQLGHGQGTVEKGQAEHIAEVQRGSTRGKCQIVFSDANHNKEYVAAQIIDITSTPAPGNPDDFKCSPSNSSSNCIPFAAPSFRSMLATGKETRKRSRGSTRSNIALRNEAVSAIVQEDGNFNQDNHAAKITKKQHKINTPSDSYPGALSSLDALVEQLRHLDINADRKQDSNINAVVVYQRDGTLVTAKKQPPRLRVVLDEETIRVSKLLQEDINSEGINGTTKEKVEWWKEERRIFGEKANSFIRCMHLIQGDRTFSRWKGSVVDSVVGVFLTQNVADHVSSSAYMSLAARFPLALKSSSCKSSEIGGYISSVQHPEMAETTKHNIEVAILPGMNMRGTEVCREESGSSREIASQGVNIEPQPQTSSGYLKNDFDVSRTKGLDSSPKNSDSLSSTNTEGKTYKANSGRNGKGKGPAVDWDSLRKQAHANGEREQTMNTLDSADWEAVRLANVEDVAHTIKERGMNNVLAERIKEFLDRLVSDHGNIDLEWLRDIPPDKAKKYLLSVNGLGMKSVECVRLLTLHHIAFPVDTNVGRIAVRLGWVPLQPLPESLQLHLLELYPLLGSVQQYLWPRLCKLDQKTLYELHYQMITFGKVFCTKNKPNCNACPLRGECRHFASAFASARLALPAPKEGTKETSEDNAVNQKPVGNIKRLQLPESLQGDQVQGANQQIRQCEPIIEVPESPEPTIEVPETPELERTQGLEDDIEDYFIEDPEDIPTIQLNIEEFTQNLRDYIQSNKELQECNVSKALVALTLEAASIPTVKLKNSSQLRTEHLVYVLPDTHPLLEGLDRRDSDDTCHYLLAIWTPGETADSIHPPAGPCRNQQSGSLCSDATCFACSCTKEAQSQTIRGTLLIPCRTAMRGSFPLNGTYFQVNEVFADHASSLRPLQVPRSLVWNLPRKKVYFGTSVTSILRGMATEQIQMCFWKGYVYVRGFERESRAPRPLLARLHFSPSKLSRGKEKKYSEE